MRTRPFLFLPVLLALSGVTLHAEGPAIEHKEIKCIVAGKFARMDACFLPTDVAAARVYFRVQGTPAWYYVDMKREQACHAGILPKAQKKLVGQHIEYYVEASDRSFSSGRTAEFGPLVVKSARECGKDLPVAPISPTGPPAVFPSLPAAFTAAPGGLSTLAVVGGVAGAGAAAGTTAVIVNKGDDTPSQFTLQVSRAGGGSGTVSSAPGGITCGGACSAPYDSGTTVTLTATPDAGSSFLGWDGACSGTGPCTVVMDAARSVGARFGRAFPLTVTRSGSGAGTVGSAPAGISCGGTCTAPFEGGTVVVLTAQPGAGNTFLGWSGAGCSGTGSCTVTMSEARTVDAAFAGASVRLTVAKAGDGTGTVASDPAGIDCGPACTKGFGVGTRVTLSARAAAGSAFTGWSGSGCSGTGTCTVAMNESHVVTATFSAQITLSVSAKGSGSGTVTSRPAGIRCSVVDSGVCSAVFDGGTLVELTASAGAGTTFVGWSGDCAGTVGNQCLLRMDSSRRAVADFSGRHTLTVNKIGNGTGTVTSDPPGINCGGTCSAPYDFGASVTLTATPGGGSIFVGWQGGCTGASPVCTVRMTDNVTVTAKFDPATFNLNLTVNGPGAVSDNVGQITNCTGTCTGTYTTGSTVVMTATPGGAGAVFVDWEGACTGGGGCSVPITQNQALRAFFGFPLTVSKTGNGTGSVSSAPGGINCGGTCAAEFRANTSVTLTASAAGGSKFTGWTSGCEGTGPCKLTMDSPHAVTAGFAALRPLTLTMEAGTPPGGGGTITSSSSEPGEPLINCTAPPFPHTCAADYSEGTVVTLTAASSDGMAWLGCDTVVFRTCTVAVGPATNVKATFIAGLTRPGSNTPSRPERESAAGASLAWTMLLDVPGAEGQVVFNGAQTAFAGPGVSRAGSTARNGENRVEARLQKADGQPGTWRFELQGQGSVEPGSFTVLQGEPVLVMPNTLVFRLTGRAGEAVMFSFRAKVSP
jgi:uncharacterized repeat protein (TIGR02543 family)